MNSSLPPSRNFHHRTLNKFFLFVLIRFFWGFFSLFSSDEILSILKASAGWPSDLRFDAKRPSDPRFLSVKKAEIRCLRIFSQSSSMSLCVRKRVLFYYQRRRLSLFLYNFFEWKYFEGFLCTSSVDVNFDFQFHTNKTHCASVEWFMKIDNDRQGFRVVTFAFDRITVGVEEAPSPRLNQLSFFERRLCKRQFGPFCDVFCLKAGTI